MPGILVVEDDENFIRLLYTNDLLEDAYTCPINVMNRTTESAIYVMELAGYGMSAYRIKTQSAFLK